MSHLLPHPWDAVADVLPPGGNYPIADLRSEEAAIRKLIAEAKESEDRADRLERDADEERDAAIDARKEARELIEEQIRPTDNDLAEHLLREVDSDDPPWHGSVRAPRPPVEPPAMGLT